jgi:hypothetical protein
MAATTAQTRRLPSADINVSERAHWECQRPSASSVLPTVDQDVVILRRCEALPIDHFSVTVPANDPYGHTSGANRWCHAVSLSTCAAAAIFALSQPLILPQS